MNLRIVGAGLGRTGTHSLKIALEQLLGAPCYHMLEVIGRPERADAWAAAARGEPTDWEALFADYAAAVDWPAASFWPEISAAFPESVVLLSVRDAEGWWESASHTIFEAVSRGGPMDDEGFRKELAMIEAIFANRFTPDWRHRDAAIAAYEAHNASVRAGVPADRLVEWHPGDGWKPLCDALGMPVPDDPFPHVNTTAEFRAMVGLDQG